VKEPKASTKAQPAAAPEGDENEGDVDEKGRPRGRS